VGFWVYKQEMCAPSWEMLVKKSELNPQKLAFSSDMTVCERGRVLKLVLSMTVLTCSDVITSDVSDIHQTSQMPDLNEVWQCKEVTAPPSSSRPRFWVVWFENMGI
jgi:hypothetical protein